MKNLVFLLLGVIFGLLLKERSVKPQVIVVPAAPAAPQKRRSLDEIAPILTQKKLDVTDWGSDEAYVNYVKTLVDQLVREGLSEIEAYTAAEEIKKQLWLLLGFDKSMETRRDVEREKRSLNWIEDIEEQDYDVNDQTSQ